MIQPKYLQALVTTPFTHDVLEITQDFYSLPFVILVAQHLNTAYQAADMLQLGT